MRPSQPCMFFFGEGTRCNKGSNCKFSHEGRGASNEQITRSAIMRPCMFFFGEGKGCNKGSNCKFSHERRGASNEQIEGCFVCFEVLDLITKKNLKSFVAKVEGWFLSNSAQKSERLERKSVLFVELAGTLSDSEVLFENLESKLERFSWIVTVFKKEDDYTYSITAEAALKSLCLESNLKPVCVTGVYGLVVDWDKDMILLQRNINSPAGRSILWKLFEYWKITGEVWSAKSLGTKVPLCCQKTWDGMHEFEREALLGLNEKFLLDWHYCIRKTNKLEKFLRDQYGLPVIKQGKNGQIASTAKARVVEPCGSLDLVGGQLDGKEFKEAFAREAREEVEKIVKVLHHVQDDIVLSSVVTVSEILVLSSITGECVAEQERTPLNIPTMLSFDEFVNSKEFLSVNRSKIVNLLKHTYSSQEISDKIKKKIKALVERLEKEEDFERQQK